MGSPHPEEYQGYYHEEHLKIFNERPYVWGTFVWNMFDFGAYFRREGDTPGLNDKGLVTYDRKTKKDAFYFYKSHWSEEPVLHITSSRYVLRKEKKTTVKVYTNLPSVSLTINGVAFPSKAPENNVIVWENIELTPGNNAIVVKGNSSGKEITDSCVWSVEESWKGMNMFIRVFDIIMISWKIVIAELIIVWLVWLWMIRKRRRMKQPLWKRIIGWTLVVILLLSAVLLIAVKLFLPTLMGN
jgi:beta-galactosidase